MSVIRVNKTNNYTVMSNYHFKEKDMSLKAKGLLSEMLSLPDDWDYSIQGLVALNKENETSIKNTLDELKVFGYLRVTKLMPDNSSTGRIEYVYDIFEKPQKAKQEGKKQGLENLGVENLGLEKQGLENQGQLNTNNKVLNNKILKINKQAEKKEYAQYVHLKEDEYNSLLDKYGKNFASRCIEVLNNYKGACGKSYKSDYLAILNWVVGRVEGEGVKKEPKVAKITEADVERQMRDLEEKNRLRYSN